MYITIYIFNVSQANTHYARVYTPEVYEVCCFSEMLALWGITEMEGEWFSSHLHINDATRTY